MKDTWGRREFLAALPAAATLFSLQDAEKLPPVRAITRGPAHHWFGYYDKREFDPTGRFVLGMEVGFEHRSPTPDDGIKVGMVDLEDGDRWIEVGESHAWCWQQGCMLQWIPGSSTEILWNDREGDRFVCHILDVKTRKKRTLPAPIYALSPDGSWAIATDFRRLHDTRPGYGYAGIPDPNADVLAPDNAGIWKVDLRTGESRLILSVAQVVKQAPLASAMDGSKHWFNHLLFNTDGTRFCFLNRWRRPGRTDFETRLLTADPEGKDLRVLDPSGSTSHFIWRDPSHILAWSKHPSGGMGFYLFEDRTENVEQIGKGVMLEDGHCTYFPGDRRVLCDTYPDRARNQNPYLFDLKSGRRLPLGHFKSPARYTGEWRCDTHPRFSPDGRAVAIDSPHGGEGRQIYLIDVSSL